MKKQLPDKAILIPDEAKLVFDGIIFDIYQWPQTEFDGSTKTYEMVKKKDTVCCIGVVDGQLLVIEDEQPHNGKWLTFPTGKVEKTDDSLLTAVKRETAEETGYVFGNWRLIQVVQPHTKMEWFIYYFVASDVERTGLQQLGAGEHITMKKLPFDEAKKLSFDKAGYLGEAEDIFRSVQTIDELLDLPEFKGQEVDR